MTPTQSSWSSRHEAPDPLGHDRRLGSPQTPRGDFMIKRNEDSYPWKQGYKTFVGANLRERRSTPISPYDPETQPLCHQSWLDGWHYAEDEYGLAR